MCCPCNSINSDTWKIKCDIQLDAPVEWVWQHFPIDFDMSKIMTELDESGNPTPGGLGVTKQRHGSNFNQMGSHIFYTTKDG